MKSVGKADTKMHPGAHKDTIAAGNCAWNRQTAVDDSMSHFPEKTSCTPAYAKIETMVAECCQFYLSPEGRRLASALKRCNMGGHPCGNLCEARRSFGESSVTYGVCGLHLSVLDGDGVDGEEVISLDEGDYGDGRRRRPTKAEITIVTRYVRLVVSHYHDSGEYQREVQAAVNRRAEPVHQQISDCLPFGYKPCGIIANTVEDNNSYN